MVVKSRGSRLPSTLKCLVWVLRCLGLYCFRKPTAAATADTVEISLPLLLWAVFVKILQMSFLILGRFFNVNYANEEVGFVTTRLNIMIAAISPLLAQSSLLINGKILCQILVICEEDALPAHRKVSCSATTFSLEGIVTLSFYCSYAVGMLGLLFGTFFDEDKITSAALGCLFVHLIGTLLLITMLFREVLTIASSQLSADFVLDGSFLLESGVAEPDPRLDTLERKIRKVSHPSKT